MNREINLQLHIDNNELLKYYRGQARSIFARTADGTSCRFPVDALKPFVTHSGVHGNFRLLIDSKGKLIDIQKLTV